MPCGRTSFAAANSRRDECSGESKLEDDSGEIHDVLDAWRKKVYERRVKVGKQLLLMYTMLTASTIMCSGML